MCEAIVPTNLQDWVTALNIAPRPGWGPWDNAGGSVYEGVQNWSENLNSDGYPIGVWGNVVPYPGHEQDEDDRPRVNWCIYIGDCVDPHKSGFESAEDAMDRAEREFPEAFK